MNGRQHQFYSKERKMKMAKFCRYCGKPLPESGICDCQQSVRAAEQIREAAPEVKTAPAPQAPQAETAQTQPNLQMDGAAEKVKETGRLFLSFFTKPADTMKQALDAPDKIPQYLIAGIFAFVMFVAAALIARNSTIAYMLRMAHKNAFSIAMVILIVFFLIRGIYAGAVFALARKYNPSIQLPSVIGLFSITFCLDTAMLVLLMAASMVSLVELQIALLLFWGTGTMLTAYLAAWAVFGGQTEKAYQITMVLHIILLIVLVFAARGIGVKIIKSGFGAIGQAIGSYGGMW